MIRSHGGAEEQMGRNGGARETWLLIRNTVSVTLIRAVPVQESLWNCQTTPSTIMITNHKHLTWHLIAASSLIKILISSTSPMLIYSHLHLINPGELWIPNTLPALNLININQIFYFVLFSYILVYLLFLSINHSL